MSCWLPYRLASRYGWDVYKAMVSRQFTSRGCTWCLNRNVARLVGIRCLLINNVRGPRTTLLVFYGYHRSLGPHCCSQLVPSLDKSHLPDLKVASRTLPLFVSTCRSLPIRRSCKTRTLFDSSCIRRGLLRRQHRVYESNTVASHLRPFRPLPSRVRTAPQSLTL